MDDSPGLAETIGQVGLLTLNRPRQMNARNDALLDADAAIGAIVITGNARALAAVADIAALTRTKAWPPFTTNASRCFNTANGPLIANGSLHHVTR